MTTRKKLNFPLQRIITAALTLLTLGLLSSICAAQPTFQVSDELHRQQLIAAAWERTEHRVRYDGSYRSISYPMGDVSDNIGVCTDVVIRAYRALGVDLQELVHKDMQKSFSAYPKHWGLTQPDANIDHRRVPNLQTFFKRHGEVLPVDHNPQTYAPGDLVTWMLPGNLPHIGIVADKKSTDGERYLVIHNVGAGPVAEDYLFRHPITGHFRYLPGHIN